MPEWREEIGKRLAGLNLEPTREAEIVEELAQHLEDRYHELLVGESTEAEACAMALAELSDKQFLADELGQVERMVKRESTVWGASARKSNFIADLWQDLHYGVRALRRSPGFATAAAITLALGIGANIAVFSIVNGVLLRPLPYDRPDELVVPISMPTANEGGGLDAYAPLHYRVLREQNSVFQDMGMFKVESADLTGWGNPESLKAAFITASVFDVLRVKAEIGRVFSAQEDIPGGGNIVLLSDRLWKRRFLGDPGIIGKSLRLNDQPYTIIGVMSESFEFPSSDTDIWSPFNVANAEIFNAPTARQAGLNVIARLRAGASLEQATNNIRAIKSTFGVRYPDDVRLTRWDNYLVGETRTALLLLLGAVGFVLLIACSNVANLLLIRGESRRKELAIRSALGASTSKLILHSLTESGLLSLMGGILGLFLAIWMVKAVMTLAPARISRLDQVKLDGNVLAFTLAATLISMLLAGLLPAFKGCKADTSGMMKGESSLTGTTRSTARHALIISELALALILLAGAGLMIRTMIYLMRIDLGFDARNVLTVRLLNPVRKGPQDNAGRSAYYDQRAAFVQDLLEKLAALPGAEAAGATSNLPLGEGLFVRVTKESTQSSSTPSSLWADPYAITHDYFRVLSVALLKGRLFNSTDNKNSPPVVIVDKLMAERFWPSVDPLGKRVRIGAGPWHTVIGVISNVRSYGLKSRRKGMFIDSGQIFFSAAQRGGPLTLVSPILTIRTNIDALHLVDAVRREVWKLDPNQPISRVATLESVVSDVSAEPRFYMALLTAFAATAFVLGMVGIYGVTSYWVAQRTHEIGVRLALGAQGSDVLRMVVGQSMALTAAGLTIGLAGSLALTRFLSGMIYGLTATDPTTFVSTCVLLGAASLGAAYIPARRATRVDPLAALRHE
jgi:putative ABC transport system permease protein